MHDRAMKSTLLALTILWACCMPGARAADGPCAAVTAAQAQGFDPVALCDVLHHFTSGTTNFHALVIERHGVVVAEAYRRGKDESIYSLFGRSTDFDATRRHDVRSISKSVTSLLWGIAKGQGKVPPLDTPVLDLLPELTDLQGQGREAITLSHLFDMSSGLDWNEPNAYNSSRNDEHGLFWHSSQARYLFDRAVVVPPGTRFNYNGGGTAVIAQILAQRVGLPLPEYARRYLFEPLGITDWEWVNDVRGRPLAFAGLRLRPIDLARIGRMVLAHGRWQGRQVVPAEWIEETLRPRIDIGDGLRYGRQWWAGTAVDAQGAKHAWTAGFGNGGQRLFVVPELDLVVVITAGDYNQVAIARLANQLFRSIAVTVRN